MVYVKCSKIEKFWVQIVLLVLQSESHYILIYITSRLYPRSQPRLHPCALEELKPIAPRVGLSWAQPFRTFHPLAKVIGPMWPKPIWPKPIQSEESLRLSLGAMSPSGSQQSLCIRHTWKEPGSLVTSSRPWINLSCDQPTSRLSGYMSQTSPFTIKPFKLGGCCIPYNDGKSCYTYS